MRLSVQLFTVRDSFQEDPCRTFDSLRRMGFKYVELAGYGGMTVSQLKQALRDADLRPSGSHVLLDQLERDLNRIAEENLELGNEWLIVPWIPEEQRDWGLLAARLNDVAQKLSATGLRLAYHNHDFEIWEGRLEHIASDTDPSLVSFEVDVGWVQFAGRDPAELLAALGSRVRLVHLKDMIVGSTNPDAVAGTGSVNWEEVLPVCRSAEFGVIEMDNPPGDPMECLEECLRYFRGQELH